MEIIVPAAGLSTRFPGMKPKYLLYDYKGDMMLMNALRTLRQNGYRIHIGILKEHQDQYKVIEQIQHEWYDNINYVILDKPTRGPADTVYQIIKSSGLTTTEILIKDCDSFFEHNITKGDNYVCVGNIKNYEVLRKLSSKSFTVANENGIITDIVEKEVVSDTFCVGGYKFSSADMFVKAFEELQIDKEVFVSDVIGRCINKGELFFNKPVHTYVDVGTSKEWFEFNDRPVIFCDIDGTIVKAQSRLDLEAQRPYEPLVNNVKRLLELQNKGAQFIFVTAREPVYRTETRQMLYHMGFMSFTLLEGLQNSRRILINDYNNANPYPRAEAINLKRDSDNLSDFI